MTRVTDIIGKVYNKYLPIIKQCQTEININICDYHLNSDQNPELLQAEIDKCLAAFLNANPHSSDKITITAKNHQIIITDSGTILSRPACAFLSKKHVQVKSRVGFGTTITINLADQDKTSKPAKLSTKSPN